MSKLFNRLTLTCLLVLALTTNAGLLFADQAPKPGSGELQEQLGTEVAGTQLAMNNADTMANNEEETSVAQTGPVLLVPMVLAVLALVAVSRRKEG